MWLPSGDVSARDDGAVTELAPAGEDRVSSYSPLMQFPVNQCAAILPTRARPHITRICKDWICTIITESLIQILEISVPDFCSVLWFCSIPASSNGHDWVPLC